MVAARRRVNKDKQFHISVCGQKTEKFLRNETHLDRKTVMGNTMTSQPDSETKLECKPAEEDHTGIMVNAIQKI
jgi:hypothetical protein